MKKRDHKKHKDSTVQIQPEKSNCYRVVDECGCIVGAYCCKGSDMTDCQYQSC